MTGIARQVFDARNACHGIWSRGCCGIARYRHISTLYVKLDVTYLLVGGPFPSHHTMITARQHFRKSHTFSNGTRKVTSIYSTTTRKLCNFKEVFRRIGVGVIAEIQITITRVASLASPSHVKRHAGLKFCLHAVRSEIMATHTGGGIRKKVCWPIERVDWLPLPIAIQFIIDIWPDAWCCQLAMPGHSAQLQDVDHYRNYLQT